MNTIMSFLGGHLWVVPLLLVFALVGAINIIKAAIGAILSPDDEDGDKDIDIKDRVQGFVQDAL